MSAEYIPSYTPKQIEELRRLYFMGYPMVDCIKVVFGKNFKPLNLEVDIQYASFIIEKYWTTPKERDIRRKALQKRLPNLIGESVARKKRSTGWLETLMRRRPGSPKVVDIALDEYRSSLSQTKWVKIVKGANISEGDKVALLKQRSTRREAPPKRKLRGKRLK